jgi:SAM-dependent methyltransferase
LCIAAAAMFTYGPLPSPDEGPKPPPLERWVFKSIGAVDEREPDVVFVPTPQWAVDRMLELAELKPGDLLYDLGCGDGRVVVTAAKRYGVRAVGVDIDPVRVFESRRNVITNGVSHRVKILRADIFNLDFSDASAVTLYLLPELNVRLMPKLAKLKPGTRIVSYEFDMLGAKPQTIVEVPGTGGSYGKERFPPPPHRIYKWVVPWEAEPKPVSN